MPHNNYFQFKQFRVEQNHAAMRVGTDGVLLGAWAEVKNASAILDIGTGTGVIALMLAQRSGAQIDAIDIGTGAIKDASHNFEQSPWKNRLNLFQSSFQNFAENSEKKYDCIVSNPPFFNNSAQSVQKERALARHTESLSYKELAKGVSKLLHTNGNFCVILPIEAEKSFQVYMLGYDMHMTKKTRVLPNLEKPCKRVLLQFEFLQKPLLENELIIETETKHKYTEQAVKLFKDFYLNL